MAWHEQRASRLKNFALVSAQKRAAGRNYSGFGFQTASSVRNAAVQNITRFAGGMRSSAAPAGIKRPSRLGRSCAWQAPSLHLVPSCIKPISTKNKLDCLLGFNSIFLVILPFIPRLVFIFIIAGVILIEIFRAVVFVAQTGRAGAEGRI